MYAFANLSNGERKLGFLKFDHMINGMQYTYHLLKFKEFVFVKM